MPYIPHTDQDIQAMLAALDITDSENLFDEIPDHLRSDGLSDIGPGLTELEVLRLMSERAAQDSGTKCFIGAGAYEHHIPAAVWDIASRGEFMTAYTPYQAEASQGTLQLIYEYQTMMTQLLAMEVSNASLYDGATALAEAILMAARVRRSAVQRVLVSEGLHPNYRTVCETLVGKQIDWVTVPIDSVTGQMDVTQLQRLIRQGDTALLLPQPNFFGIIEDVDPLVDCAHQHEVAVIAVVNPVAMALLKPPGHWGQKGVDIAVGEGQPLGIPLASGGPYFGFMSTRKKFIRQMPGRLVGRTKDTAGNTGYTLTLQAREQHIRRAKATSNICTNQGWAVTAATIYLSLLGAKGLKQVALTCHQNCRRLMDELKQVAGVEPLFSGPYFHEQVIRLPKSAQQVFDQMAKHGIQAGYPLRSLALEYKNALLVCVTETKTEADVKQYVELLQLILGEI